MSADCSKYIKRNSEGKSFSLGITLFHTERQADNSGEYSYDSGFPQFFLRKTPKIQEKIKYFSSFNCLQNFQMESCQPIKRLKDKKKVLIVKGKVQALR